MKLRKRIWTIREGFTPRALLILGLHKLEKMKGEKPSYEKILRSYLNKNTPVYEAHELAAEEYAKQCVEYHEHQLKQKELEKSYFEKDIEKHLRNNGSIESVDFSEGVFKPFIRQPNQEHTYRYCYEVKLSDKSTYCYYLSNPKEKRRIDDFLKDILTDNQGVSKMIDLGYLDDFEIETEIDEKTGDTLVTKIERKENR